MIISNTYYSNGKLLLTGEYVVLDGALSLALPSTYGQHLTVTKIEAPKIIWTSLNEKGIVWFKTVLHNDTFKMLNSYYNKELIETPPDMSNAIESSSNNTITKTLLHILAEALKLNPAFLGTANGYEIVTRLTFPRNWGLGSSSTLINNIARWARVNPYTLLFNSFPGSGYDIACAQQRQPVIYQLKDKKPIVKPTTFHPPFAAQLYFVHLNKKQNTRKGIRIYCAVKENKSDTIKAISEITEKMVLTTGLSAFEELLEEHENYIACLLKLPKIKTQLFDDYFGSIKSLGAWGGDFILATGNEETPAYFTQKGFTTVIPYHKMVLSGP